MWQPFGSPIPSTVQRPSEPVSIRSSQKKLLLVHDVRIEPEEKQFVLFVSKHLYCHDVTAVSTKSVLLQTLGEDCVIGDCLLVHVSVAPNGIQKLGEIQLDETVTADELRQSLLAAPSGLTILLFVNGHFPPLLRYRHMFRGTEHDVHEDVTIEESDADIWMFSGPSASEYFLSVAQSKGLLQKMREYCSPSCTVETGKLKSQPSQILAKILGAPLV